MDPERAMVLNFVRAHSFHPADFTIRIGWGVAAQSRDGTLCGQTIPVTPLARFTVSVSQKAIELTAISLR